MLLQCDINPAWQSRQQFAMNGVQLKNLCHTFTIRRQF